MRESVTVLDTRVVTGSGGGPDKTILNSPRFLISAGYRMLCAYLYPPGDEGFETIRAKAEAHDAPLIGMPDRGPLDWRVVPQMLDVCRRENVTIWHGHDYKTNALGLLLSRWHPMRLVTTVHGWVRHTLKTPLYYGIDRLCLPRYERVFCVSPDLVADCLSCGVSESRCELLENGIDVDAYQPTCDTARAKRDLGLPAERNVIAAVGRLSPEKGFDTLLSAFAHVVHDQGRDAQLVIVGEGDERPNLERLTAELRLSDRVTLMGYRADPRPVYAAADLFALSSLREGLPNVVLEAMAMGVAVVATRINGVPRLVEDNANGVLVPAGQAAMLAQAIERLLADPERRVRLGRAGRLTVESRYSFARRMDRLAACYDAMLLRN